VNRQPILLVFILLSWGVALPIRAQTTAGGILGSVADPSRARVPDAQVTATNLATALVFPTRTNADGLFAISQLPPGPYQVIVRKAGFKPLTRTDLEVNVDQQLRLDLTLEVGGPAEAVRISGAPATLQTQNSGTGMVIGSRQILDLPLLGRDFLELTLLVPGVASGAGGNNANYSVNGQREFANSILVNGIEVTGNRNNDTDVRPSVEAVEEFKLATSGYAAEFGGSAGGVIAVQTRSGSNEFHGSLFEFLRTNATTARTFFAAEPSGKKENDFGGSLGGPLVKNRTFFFVAYEGKRQRDLFSYLDTTVPSEMIQVLPNGGVDLSGLRDPYTGKPIPIFDPGFYNTNFYSSQFAGNIIPASRVSPAGRHVLQQLFPKPNAPGILNGWFNNFQVSQRYQYASDVGDLRVDHSFGGRDRLSLTYDVLNFRDLTGDPFAGAIPIPGGGGADSADQTTSANHSVSGAYTRIVSATQLNELRVGFVHTPLRQDTLIQGDVANQLGIGGVNLNGFPATSGLPQIYLAFGAIAGGSTYKPLTFSDDNLSLADNYTWNRGSHSFKFGYEYRHLLSHPDFSLFPTGFQYYSGAYNSLTSDPTYGYFDKGAYYGNGGNEIADLLLGLPGSVSLGLQLTNPVTRSYEQEAYAQDSWRLTPRLTLNYGVRYEFQAPWEEIHNHQANFDPASQGMLLAGVGANSNGLVRPDKNNFAPRIGLAWQMNSQTVLRTGYGIFYTPENSARSDILTKNYPFFYQQTFANNLGTPFTYLLDSGVSRPTAVPIPSGASSIPLVSLPNAAVQNIFYEDPVFRTGYAEMFHLTTEREITRELTVEATYAGVLSHKLPYQVGNLNLGNAISKQLGIVEALFSEGNAAYHSLQLKAERRFRTFYSFLVSYTYAKNLDNGPAPFDLNYNHQAPQNAMNLSMERGPASIDLRHNLVASHLWELPFGRNRKFFNNCGNFCQALVGNWHFDGITTWRSGLPANVVRNGQLTGYTGLRPNVLRDPNLDPAQRSLSHYFDTQAFSVAGLGKTQPGNAGRNLIRGPGLFNLDVALFKDVRLPKERALQFRVDAFNLSNTPHFANPSTDLSQGQFGSITQTIGDPRILQFAAKLKF
jgi:hypothetical protein